MSIRQKYLIPDVRKLEQLTSGLSNELDEIWGAIGQVNMQVSSLLDTRASTPASPVANLLYNGEMGHSVNSWFDNTYQVNDKAYECAWFYTNNRPAAIQTFTAIVNADEIPLPNHQFTTGCAVRFYDDGDTLPTGLAFNVTYFVIQIDTNTISLASSVGNAFAGTAIAITAGTGTGTHTIQQWLSETDARTSAVNNTLKSTDHTNYNPRYSKWGRTDGQGYLTGTMTIDALMPANIVDSTTPLARISLIAARRSRYIELPDACLFAGGIWDATDGQARFLTGAISFTASYTGSAGSIERRFRIFIKSDRGYSLLSDEVIILNTVADLDATNFISMSWRTQTGQLAVEIYEHYDVGGPDEEFRWVTEVSSASTFIYNGGYLITVGGYPSATGNERTATFFTNTGNIRSMAVNGISATWDTVNLPIQVPNNYNKAVTTGRQWARIWLTVEPNLLVSGCDSDGASPNSTITAPAAVFENEYAALYPGMEVLCYDAGGALIATTVILSRPNDTQIVVDDEVVMTGGTIRVIGAGFHGVIVDKIHLGYQQNTSYAPNANDVRVLQPVALPPQSNQGTVGGGGDGGGIGTCIRQDMPVKLRDGKRVQVRFIEPGTLLSDGGVNGNILVKTRVSRSRVRWVRAANGVELACTDSERFVTHRSDIDGRMLSELRVGDTVLTEVDGRIEESELVEITSLQEWATVYTPSLSNNHYFIAGMIRTKKGVWQWLKRHLRIGKPEPESGGFVLHNNKVIIE